MNPEHGRVGYKPNSNTIYFQDKALLESKREKVVEIFKQSTEVFEILETAKRDPVILQATKGGQGLDPHSMSETLMADPHFNNCKDLVTF